MPISRAAASTICSRATVSNIHGPRYAPRPHVFVHTARVRSDASGHSVRTGEQQPDERARATGRADRERARVLEVVDVRAEQAAVGVERERAVARRRRARGSTR